MKKFIFLLIILHLTFNIEYCTCQWFKLPDLPDSGIVYKMQFINPNTGWLSTATSYIPFYRTFMKTTNGGVSWTRIQNTGQVMIFNFINDSLGFGIDWTGSNFSKTTNGGLNWNVISTGNGFGDMFFANKDTGWTCGFDGNLSGVWRTTDGGNSWTRQYTVNSNGLDRIFFLKNKVNGEYWGWTFKYSALFRTTNSGINWTLINSSLGGGCGDGGDIYFKDTSTGIITRNNLCFSTTTNGGFNWTHHYDSRSVSSKIAVGDSNKLWLTIGTRDSLYKTNNFFQSYGIQVTSSYATNVFALDTSVVYAGYNMTNMQKTTNGGGPIIYAGIDSQSVSIPLYYSLYQNYPNPFNPTTTIKFFIRSKSYISLTIYDMEGKEVIKLYNNTLLSYGGYKAIVDFGMLNLSSGTYFYRMTAKALKGIELYSETKKMVYIK